jgi:hypothetical protein
MGRVSIWGQWLIIVSGVLLSPLFVLFMAGATGWLLLRRLQRPGRTVCRAVQTPWSSSADKPESGRAR